MCHTNSRYTPMVVVALVEMANNREKVTFIATYNFISLV
jgi:hypothetical protein